MSIEYNSLLIANLFSSEEENEIQQILEEMGEIGDPIFLYPVYQKYKIVKNASISHYFIITLDAINSNDVIQIALEIDKNPKKEADRKYLLYIFDKRKFYKNEAINICNAWKRINLFGTH